MTTPHLALRQGVFDIVVEGAAKMDRRCTFGGGCAYRDDKGGACFVGLLLSDEEVMDPETGKLLHGVVGMIADKLPERLLPHLSLLSDLQPIHDASLNWADGGDGPMIRERVRAQLVRVAESRGLNTKSIDEHFPA